jgi:heme exporter protein C
VTFREGDKITHMAQRNPPTPQSGPPLGLSADRSRTLRPSLLFALAWLAATLALLAYGFRQAIFIAPTEATMGNVQRIFYWHVPSALLGLIFPYVNFVASLAFLYLRRRNPLSALTADAIAVSAAEVTVVFTSICLATGMLWGRASWGIWWAWDARLTSLLLLWLLYVAYLMTRRLSATGQTSTLGAVLAVFAAIDVPIVYFSIQWWRTQHPSPVLTGDGQMAAPMWVAFGWNCLAWLMWGLFILGFRFALERRRQRADQEATLHSLEASLTEDDGLNHLNGSEPNNAF